MSAQEAAARAQLHSIARHWTIRAETPSGTVLSRSTTLALHGLSTLTRHRRCSRSQSRIYRRRHQATRWVASFRGATQRRLTAGSALIQVDRRGVLVLQMRIIKVIAALQTVTETMTR